MEGRVVLFDSSNPKDPQLKLWWDLHKAHKQNVIGVANLSDGATALGKHNNLDIVMLFGHGLPGLIGLGSGTASIYEPTMDIEYAHIKNENAQKFLAAVAGALSPGGILFLCGCRVGDTFEEGGTEILEAVSSFRSDLLILAPGPYITIKKDDKKIMICKANENLKPGGQLEWNDVHLALDGGLDEEYSSLDWIKIQESWAKITFWG